MASNVALKEKCEASLKILKDLKNKQGPGYIHERKVWEALGLHLMKNDAPWRLLYTHLKQIKRQPESKEYIGKCQNKILTIHRNTWERKWQCIATSIFRNRLNFCLNIGKEPVQTTCRFGKVWCVGNRR